MHKHGCNSKKTKANGGETTIKKLTTIHTGYSYNYYVYIESGDLAVMLKVVVGVLLLSFFSLTSFVMRRNALDIKRQQRVVVALKMMAINRELVW